MAILKKEDLNKFISALAKEDKVMAPVPRGYKNYAFCEVSNASEIAIKYIPTILPPKKYFTPQRETLLEFDTTKGQDTQAVLEYEKMVIFGVHTCDLAGIQCLDAVFGEKPKDNNYLKRKESITIIGLECNEYCDEHASCTLMDSNLPKGGYDLFFTDIGDCFIVHINTKTGEEIIKNTKLFKEAENAHLSSLDKLREKKKTIFKNEVPIKLQDIPRIFDKSFDSPVWKDIGTRCLACGNCTNVCPSCYCFDVIDEINLDLKTGRRYRVWDSCQVEPFAKVAGNHNFRKERSARQKHRYYRKFRYPVDKYKLFFCTGCGRCTRTCMAKINLKETLDSLIEENS